MKRLTETMKKLTARIGKLVGKIKEWGKANRQRIDSIGFYVLIALVLSCGFWPMYKAAGSELIIGLILGPFVGSISFLLLGLSFWLIVGIAVSLIGSLGIGLALLVRKILKAVH